MDDFNWDEKSDVLFKSVQAVAVYPNADGDVVIRQHAEWDADQDTIIIFPSNYAKAVAQAILRAANEVGE